MEKKIMYCYCYCYLQQMNNKGILMAGKFSRNFWGEQLASRLKYFIYTADTFIYFMNTYKSVPSRKSIKRVPSRKSIKRVPSRKSISSHNYVINTNMIQQVIRHSSTSDMYLYHLLYAIDWMARTLGLIAPVKLVHKRPAK